ncbi:MAG: hypothetical protein CME65_10090 [Halobacteriovoraceae bacterium]|nr:hypothetical protein [Halobacteriovoraceae bacterium]|tara:strand:- start:2647 stop:3012 length:366 start_codon:yes stop_codon:yes gene_type:complete
MKRLALVFVFTLMPFAFAQGKFTKSFIVKIGDRVTKVSSPKEKHDVVSIILDNETLDKIIGQLKTADNKVISRVTLNPESKEVIQVDMRKVNQLFFVPYAPPGEAVELRFSQEDYEVPEKK